MVMVCAEWWCFEVLIVFAGIMGVLEQDCQTLIAAITGVQFQMALGMQNAASALIGNTIGAKNPSLTWKAFKMMSYLATLYFIAISCALRSD